MRQVGGHRLVRRIAVGGMAELFEAQDDAGGPVVVKVVLPQYARDTDFIQMLEDEARLCERLDHENLVKVLDHGRDGDQHYLVMDYVDGPTLAQLLRPARKQKKRPPTTVAFSVCRQLLEALRYLHNLTDDEGTPLEVVHRDVTPANVLVARDSGKVKLGDLGIARHRLRGTRTRTGVIKGTVQYMAPEQVTGDAVDARADLYGVGLILFELLTLRPFIHGEREVELLRLAEDPPWTPPSTLHDVLTPQVDRLVQRAVCRFPEERYPNAEAFLAAIEDVEATIPGPLEEDPLRSWVEELDLEEPTAAGGVVSSATGPGAAAGTRVAPVVTKPSRAWVLALVLALPLALASTALVWLLPDNPAAEHVDAGEAMTPDLALADQMVDRIASADAARSDLRAPDQTRPTPKVTRPIRIKRPPTVKIAPDAAPPRSSNQRRGKLQARFKEAIRALSGRGILVDDLRSALRSRVRALPKMFEGDALDGAEKALAALENDLGQVKVDKALVEAKMKRVDRRLRRGGVPAALKERAARALQDVMDGRYQEANRLLNGILRALR